MSSTVILVDDTAPTAVDVADLPHATSTAAAKEPRRGRVLRSSKKQIAGTLKDLEANLRAGETERKACETLGRVYTGTTVGEAYSRMAVELEANRGTSLSAAFEAEHAIFPRVVRDLIAAGAEGTDATLWRNLRRGAELLENSSNVVADTRNGIRGPVGMIVLTVVLLGVVVNTSFSSTQMGGLAGVVVDVTVKAVSVLGVVAGIFSATVIGVAIWWKNAGQHKPRARLAVDRWMLRSRLFREVTRLDAGARFSEVLAATLDIPLDESRALEIAARAAGNSAIRAHVESHIEKMGAEGKSLADVADEALFPWTLKHRLDLQPGDAERIQTLQELAQTYSKGAREESRAVVRKITDRVTNLSYVFIVLVILAMVVPSMIQITEMTSILHV